MTDRDYERAERRRRSREKGKITSIIAVGVIVLALIAIIVVVIALIGKNQPAAPTEETVAATEQPTLYVPSTSSPTPSERATSAAQPTSPSYDETEAAPDVQDEPDTPDDTDDNDDDSDNSPGSAFAAGGALHYYAYGGTSGGYNWTYDSMGDVGVTCKYNFDEGQYDFTLTGISPGETSVTLIYYAADDQPVEVSLNVRVNDDLSVDLL